MNKIFSAEHRKNLSKALKGRIFSDEHRKHLSEARIGMKETEEHRRHIGDAQRGKKLSPETIEKMRQAHIGLGHSEETRKRMSETRRGIKRSEEFKEKIRRAVLGRHHRPESLEKMRGMRNHWNGGRVKCQGYIKIHTPDHPHIHKPSKYVFEHRLIVEKLIGRYLLPKESVHHINKIRDDNRPENLMAFINERAHQQFERAKKFTPGDIIFDGRLLKH